PPASILSLVPAAMQTAGPGENADDHTRCLMAGASVKASVHLERPTLTIVVVAFTSTPDKTPSYALRWDARFVAAEALLAVRADEQGRIPYHLGQSRRIRADHRRPARHRLERGEAEALQERREDEDGRAGIEGREVVVVDAAGVDHVRAARRRRDARHQAIGPVVRRSGDHQLHRLAQPGSHALERR